jgi:hypothetical protein
MPRVKKCPVHGARCKDCPWWDKYILTHEDDADED